MKRCGASQSKDKHSMRLIMLYYAQEQKKELLLAFLS